MTLQQLKYVIAIAEKGSINEAAKVLYISQPSLTNAMHDLENDLGIQLFIRNNKGIRVTNKGEEFLRYARQVIEQVVLLEDKYLNMNRKNSIFIYLPNIITLRSGHLLIWCRNMGRMSMIWHFRRRRHMTL